MLWFDFSGNIYRWNNELNWARKVCEMILFIGGPVDWEGGPVDWGMGGRRHGRHGWGHWIPWERLRDSPELRVWRKRIRSDDRQINGQTEFPLLDSTPGRGRVKRNHFATIVISASFVETSWDWCLPNWELKGENDFASTHRWDHLFNICHDQQSMDRCTFSL